MKIYRKKTPMHWPLLSSGLLVASALAVVLPANPAQAQHVPPTHENPAPIIGAPAVPFDLKTLDGKAAGLETFRGKPLVLNFFASWCDPCREEMPLINDLALAGEKQGYNVLGIAVDDSRGALNEYVREAKLMFPIALDLNSTVKRSYRIFGPPATFFIDGHGVIRDLVLGPITPQRTGEALKKSGILSK